jgi:pyruvate dehydrogenase E2 component (dihydrolipoamide acetyltransferase)
MVAGRPRLARTGARESKLAPAELRGSTFTVSNFGALGVDDGAPVINHPQAAILGMGAIKPRPVAVGDQVARFICELGDLIESPQTAPLDL